MFVACCWYMSMLSPAANSTIAYLLLASICGPKTTTLLLPENLSILFLFYALCFPVLPLVLVLNLLCMLIASFSSFYKFKIAEALQLTNFYIMLISFMCFSIKYFLFVINYQMCSIDCVQLFVCKLLSRLML